MANKEIRLGWPFGESDYVIFDAATAAADGRRRGGGVGGRGWYTRKKERMNE